MHRARYLIGMLTLLAAVLGALWIVRLLRSLDDRPGLSLQIEFDDARGLRAGADVRYRGVTVGTVRAVTISTDGSKAVAHALLDAAGAAHAAVDSEFWIVTPRFGGITGGATGLDTLVRDSYLTFLTPNERGTPLVPGSLLSGRERPPTSANGEALEDVQHGDLLMTLLVPENHGLEPGSAVVHRGVQTGDVRSVQLAPAGTHVEVQLRIARRHRQTVTDRSVFWVARPYVSGALFSGFTLTDVGSLLSPFVSYYGEPGQGVLVQDGYRAAAEANRPSVEPSAVPAAALRSSAAPAPAAADAGVVLVRITYAAVERDVLSADDPIARQGTGLLLLDRAGRAVVVTARSLVDGSFTERDWFGMAPDIADEQLQVLLPDGQVLRAGRVWVDPSGADLAALVLDGAPPTLVGTPPERLSFDAAPVPPALTLRCAGPDARLLPERPFEASDADPGDCLGGALLQTDLVHGLLGRRDGTGAQTFVPLAHLPADLRP